LVGSVPGILIASKLPLKVPQNVLRLALAVILALSGIKLLNVPQASWILAAGLGGLLGGLALYGMNLMLRRPRPAPAGGFE
jgi:hypothetical protein